MVLQNSGPISLKDISVEFGGAAPHKLSEYYGVAPVLPTTGRITIGNFYGKSNRPDPPTWITAANLGIVTNSTGFSKTVSAYSDSNVTLSSVSIPFGSFSVTGNTATLSGTTPNVTKTTYTWTIRATDEELQTTDRDFTMIVSTAPSFSTSSNLGSYNTNTSFGLYLSASSDSSVTFSMQVIASSFGTVQSNGYFSGTTASYGGTFTWTIRATDQEGQYADRQFSMTVLQPQLIQHGIAGTWYDSNGAVYVYNSIYYMNDSTSGYFTYNSRPAFTLTVVGTNVISMNFPDAGVITGTVVYSGSTWYISQNNGTSWRR